MYITLNTLAAQSFSLDVLELLVLVEEVVGVGLGHEAALIWLLDKILIALLVGKGDSILLGLERQIGSLHSVRRGLPAHERVLPPVTPLQDIPVHAPVV